MQVNQTVLKRIGNLCVAIGMAATVGFALTHFISLFHHLEVRTQDIRETGFSQRLPQDKKIVVVAINEETLGQFPYRSPVDREFLAKLLINLEAKQAKAIYLDVLLDQPTEVDKDNALKQAIQSLRTPLAIGYTESPEVVTAEQLDYLKDFFSARYRASVNLATDPFDGTVRWLNGGAHGPDQAMGVPFKLAQLMGQQAPMIEAQSMVAWRRAAAEGESAFAIYPSHAIEHLPAEWFKDKLVMVGAVLSLTDRHRTPFASLQDETLGMMPGVVVLAHQASMLLDARRVNMPSTLQAGAVVMLFSLLGALLGWVRKSVIVTVLSGAGVLTVYWAVAFLQYDAIQWMLPLVAPSLAFVIAMFLSDVIMGKEERDRRKFVQSAFSRYLSPAVVQQLVDQPDSLAIQGEKKVLSFIFTDIQGFTTLSEKISPDLLSTILNDYLEGMCAVIDQFEGTIDKFIGDSVMCFFNAPVDQEDHADRAVNCALALDAFCEKFRQRCRADGIDLGVTRIGVHSGEAVVGNFGSARKMEFTALGDTVNAASRTEGVNKYFGTRMCVTEDVVRNSLHLDVLLRPIGNIVLKGKVKPIVLYEPLPKNEQSAAGLSRYMSAYSKVAQGDAAATEELTSMLDDEPSDGLVKFHLDRIQRGLVTVDVHMEDK
jgi:class 3 adenylate cyclase/CHASE2 domain-containing sensor protein